MVRRLRLPSTRLPQVVIGHNTRDSAGRPTEKSGDVGAERVGEPLRAGSPQPPARSPGNVHAPLMAPNCEGGAASTVAPQALLLMNSEFMVECCETFATRLESEAGSDPTARVKLAWRLALGRLRHPEQAADALAFVATQEADLAARPDPTKSAAKHAWASLCQALMSSTRSFMSIEDSSWALPTIAMSQQR